MDSSGNNRYELLFMDDDISDPLDNVVAKNKKQVKTTTTAGGGTAPSSSTNKPSGESVTAAKAGQSNKKLPHQAEKENKPLAMNKNDLNKKQTGGTLSSTPGHTVDKFNSKQGGAAGAGNGNGNNGNGNVNRKRNGPGNDTREPGQGQGPRSVNFKQQNGDTREQRNNRRNIKEFGSNNGASVGDGASQQQQQPRQFRDRDNRGPPRSRNFEGNNRGGKREFDRQSGSDKTGVKAIDKRDGAGAHNWGSVKEAIDDVNKNDSDTGVAAEKAEESGNEQVDQAAVEEETKELTLDEWKAQKQQRAKPTYNIRKAGEGEDTSQWKKMVVLNNAKKKENESEDELEFDPAMYPQRVGRQQRVLDIQFNFNDGRRGGGGGGFGGRGRGRGQRPMGGGGPFGGGGGGGAGGPGAFNGAPGGITPNASIANISERPPGRGGFEGGRGNFASATGRGGKRTFGGERQQNTAPKVNDERQFPTLA